ncbi:dual specificity phosphatase-like protein [Leishmania tarentolae]|uniref:protein-tyrosine-phosphatase n=1 Tax=Leishmania tarentolae TaxID=5689 RepID=A0A640K9G6_LEITA|nr:dual specificity phosphatase-like protein [Leishmania tarentolae]
MSSLSPVQPPDERPPPLHSPHSPYNKSVASSCGSSGEKAEGRSARRSKLSQSQSSSPLTPHQQQQPVEDGDGGLPDADASGLGLWGQSTSQSLTPINESASGPNVMPSVVSVGVATPPLGVAKDARLACRQYLEEVYTPTCASEAGGESGRPQKKELRLEDCTANLSHYRFAFSPAYALSTATSASLDTGCTDGRDFSVFSFGSSVRDNVDALTASSCRHAMQVTPRGTVATDNAAAPGAPLPGSRMSKCKRFLQALNGPAFDLKAVQEAQHSFLEEETVCNAAQACPMSNITSLLAVGSWKDASNPELLKAHNIGYVLNVAKELIPTEEAKMIAENNDIVSEWIPMSDSHTQDVSEHLIKAFRFIERARSGNSRVLVHCRRGISRSAAIIVAYLMASEHRSYEDALKFVTDRRSCVSLNLAFQERLSEFVPGSEFFHGPPAPPQQKSGAATTTSPTSPCSSNCLLPTLVDVALHTDSGNAENCCQAQPLQGSDHPLQLRPERQSVMSSTSSSRASSSVRTASSQSLGTLRLGKQVGALCSTPSTATPASRTASEQSGRSMCLEGALRSHAPPKQPQICCDSDAPQALSSSSTATRLSARSAATAATPGLRSAEEAVTATSAPESVGFRDNGDDEVKEPCSPMGVHDHRHDYTDARRRV